MARKKQTPNQKQKLNQKKGSKRKSNGKNLHLAATLPSGYKVIGRAQNWEPQKHKLITGVRGETHTVIMDKGTKTEREIRNFILQEDELGAITVWESAMLKDLFDQTEDGDQISIEFLGFGEAKKGQQPPKLFACGVKE